MLITIVSSGSVAFADTDYDEKLAFAGSLEETLGHFWAIEQNLDDNNAELALVHATHPIAELYATMKPDLQKNDPQLDAHVTTNSHGSWQENRKRRNTTRRSKGTR